MNDVRDVTCAKCGRRLESWSTSVLADGKTVCGICALKLQKPPVAKITRRATPPATVIPYATPVPQEEPATPEMLPSNWIICPNPHCGYKGEPARKINGESCLIFLILLCLFIIPAIIYAAMSDEYRLYCPRCKMRIT
jgi:hypothetical protein